jgi:hypothetical protein
MLFSGQAAAFDLLEDARAQGHQFDLLLKPVPPTELLFELGKMINGTAAIQAVLPERAKAKEDPSGKLEANCLTCRNGR